jgi:poly [ADP-ribose] polymerase 2/3/4
MSSKSANYCCAEDSDETGLLLLCEVELGNSMIELTDADHGADELVEMDEEAVAVWGKGIVGPSTWKNASCVHEGLDGITMPDTSVTPGPTYAEDAELRYNEYIVYNVGQVRLRYLFRVNMYDPWDW